MANGYRVAAFGGPEVMVWESLDLGELAPGAVRVRVGASGINFAETRMRAGDYSGQELPFVMGWRSRAPLRRWAQALPNSMRVTGSLAVSAGPTRKSWTATPIT